MGRSTFQGETKENQADNKSQEKEVKSIQLVNSFLLALFIVLNVFINLSCKRKLYNLFRKL